MTTTTTTTRTRPHKGMRLRWLGSTDGQLTALVVSDVRGGAFWAGRELFSVTIRWDDEPVDSTLSCPDGFLPHDFEDLGV